MNSQISNQDPYARLGLKRGADDAAVKRAYFRLVREHPPEQDPDTFQEIRAAYERIRTAEDRARTDLFLLQPPPSLPNRRRPSYDLGLHRQEITTLALEMVLAKKK